MSPQNCSAILSPLWVRSSPQRRRSDEGMGIEGEPERIASDACSGVDFGRSAESGQSSQAFGDLGTAGEAITAQDEAWGRGGFGSRQPWQGGVEQDDVREAGEDHRLGRGTVSRVQRYAFDGEAQREGKDRFITADRAPAVTGGGDRRRTQAWGEATLQAARAQSTGGSAVVVGWESTSLVGRGTRSVESDSSDGRRHRGFVARGVCSRRGRPELFDLFKARGAGQGHSAGPVHGPPWDLPS